MALGVSLEKDGEDRLWATHRGGLLARLEFRRTGHTAGVAMTFFAFWSIAVARRGRPGVALILLALAAALAFQGRAIAHEIRPAIATIELRPDGNLELDLSLNLEALIAVIGPDHRDSSTSANAGEYNRLRALPPERLREAYDAFEPTLIEGIVLEDSRGHRVGLAPTRIDVDPVGDTGIQRTSLIVLSGRVPEGPALSDGDSAKPSGQASSGRAKAGGRSSCRTIS